MKRLVVLIISITTLPSIAQQSITLEECYSLVETNYPLVKQHLLLEQQNQLDSQVISNTKLPQFNLEAQATYQSDVIEIPIPNSTIEPLNKEQYRAILSVNQPIYNAGATDASLDVKSTQEKTKQKQVEVNLYKLKQRINQYYFSILLTKETTTLLKAKQTRLQAKLSEVKTGIEYGVVLPSSDKILKVELLKIKQQFIEVESNKMVLIESLSKIIGQSLDASIAFQKPLMETQFDTELNRPELELFQLQKEEIESFITSDLTIIALRTEVLNSADSKLKNRVITSSAYITELTNLNEDKSTMAKHKIQLPLATANYNVIKGQQLFRNEKTPLYNWNKHSHCQSLFL